MDTEPRTSRSIDEDDEDASDLPRRRPNLARGLMDATTDLWAGGFRVMGTLLVDLGDSIAGPRTVRARRRGRSSTSDEPAQSMMDNGTNMVDAVSGSLSNGISGAAITLQRSLNIVASSIAPPDDQPDEDVVGEGGRARRRRNREATRTRVASTRESVEPGTD